MLRFGALGAADITPLALIHPCMNEPRASVSVIAARDRHKAEGFARYQKISKVVDDYQQVINHPDCEAVYVPLPISLHHDWTLAALEAGKHVLCEKSLASNEAEARRMAEVANTSGLILMDAFHYRYHPLFHHAREVYASGDLGDIHQIEAVFTVPGIDNPKDIRLDFNTSGGVTMDIGCYPISWIRHLTAQEPTVIAASAEVGPPDVDLMLHATMTLPGGIEASALGDMRPNGRFRAEVIVTGSRGSMTIQNPLAPQMGHRLTTLIDGKQTNRQFDRRPSYSYQLDAFLDAVASGNPPITDGEDGVKQLRVIDDCYRVAGLPLRGSN